MPSLLKIGMRVGKKPCLSETARYKGCSDKEYKEIKYGKEITAEKTVIPAIFLNMPRFFLKRNQPHNKPFSRKRYVQK